MSDGVVGMIKFKFRCLKEGTSKITLTFVPIELFMPFDTVYQLNYIIINKAFIFFFFELKKKSDIDFREADPNIHFIFY